MYELIFAAKPTHYLFKDRTGIRFDKLLRNIDANMWDRSQDPPVAVIAPLGKDPRING